MGFLDQVRSQQAVNPNPVPPSAVGGAPPPQGVNATGAAPAADRYEGIKPRAARAPFFKEGVHTVECQFTRMFSSPQNGDKFKLQFKILSSTNPAHPEGSEAAIVEDITPGQALTVNGGGARVKGYIVSMAGYSDEDTARAQLPGFGDLINAAHGYTKRSDGTANPFATLNMQGEPTDSNPFAGEKYIVRATPAMYGPKHEKHGQVVTTKTGEVCCRYEISAVRA